jgi:hypothetical protein
MPRGKGPVCEKPLPPFYYIGENFAGICLRIMFFCRPPYSML